MRILMVLVMVLAILFVPSCSSRNDTIDMENIMDKTKKDEKRVDNADEARKSIFPNMKDK